jgi:hypothetical protein
MRQVCRTGAAAAMPETQISPLPGGGEKGGCCSNICVKYMYISGVVFDHAAKFFDHWMKGNVFLLGYLNSLFLATRSGVSYRRATSVPGEPCVSGA